MCATLFSTFSYDERSSAFAFTRNGERERTLTAPFTNTRLLSLLILNTSCRVFDLSPRMRIWSPGTTFQNLIRSGVRTDLSFGSYIDRRTRHAFGTVRRWLRLVVYGLVVVASMAARRVKYLREDDMTCRLTPSRVKDWEEEVVAVNETAEFSRPESVIWQAERQKFEPRDDNYLLVPFRAEAGRQNDHCLRCHYIVNQESSSKQYSCCTTKRVGATNK